MALSPSSPLIWCLMGRKKEEGGSPTLLLNDRGPASFEACRDAVLSPEGEWGAAGWKQRWNLPG